MLSSAFRDRHGVHPPRRTLVEPLESRTLLASVPAGFSDSIVTTGLSSPSAMALAPDGRMFVAQQTGALRIVKNGSLLSTPFVTVSTTSTGERGLIGVALDPQFSTNGYVYVYYTHYTGASPTLHNRVSRFTANGDVAIPGSELVLLQTGDISAASNHNGGALHFGPDGKLYIAVGDNAFSNNSQTLSNVFGKMLRINKDGTIPTDNPFYNQASGVNRSIWATGLRNPYTFAFQPGSGRMFINDVGWFSWEEVNEGAAGGNYGWPNSEGPTSNPSHIGPVYAYQHPSSGGAAITGGVFYNPATPTFPGSFSGHYFFADYTSGYIKHFNPTSPPANNTAPTFATGINRPLDLDVGPDGSLYYLFRASGSSGGIGRIQYTPATAPAIAQHPQNQTATNGYSATFTVSATGATPLSYQWQRNGQNINGANSPSYTINAVSFADNNASFRCIVSNAFGNATSNSATLSVVSNRAPEPVIHAPIHNSLYSGGETIFFDGWATDPEDGTISRTRFKWTIELHHQDHTHPFLAFEGTRNGSFTIPTVGETDPVQWYRVHLTVTDSQNLAGSTYVDIQPRKSTITLATNIAGTTLTLDGTPQNPPLAVLGVVGMRRTIGAPSPQSVGGKTYEFVSWSDGGAATHNIFTPASNTAYTATFREVENGGGEDAVTLSAIADAYVRDGSHASTNFGQTTEMQVKRSSTANSGNNRETYLKFDLSTVASIGSAKLRLFARLSSTEASNVVTAIYPVSNSSWSENGITFNNRPVSGSGELARFTTANTTGQWYEVDLTNYLKTEKAAGRNLVTVALKGIANASPFTIVNSDEAAANKPQLVITPGTPSSQTSLPAVADSYVRDGTSANSNFGGQASMIVKRGNSGNNRHSYLLFDLSSVSTINSAKLRLFGGLSDNRVANIPTAVYGTAGGAWGENTITWNNRPAVTTGALATVTVTDATARWYEWDLTSYLKQQKAAGKNQVTLVLQNLSGGDPTTLFNTREASSNRPELLIT